MNEYVGTYIVRRKLHQRPILEVMDRVLDMVKEYRKTGEFNVEFSCNGNSYTPENPYVLSMLRLCHVIRRREELKIRAFGELEKETLKKITDHIGKRVEIESDERSMWEIIYKNEYGHYPDEEPARVKKG